MIESIIVNTGNHQYPIVIDDMILEVNDFIDLFSPHLKEPVAVITNEVVEPLYLQLWLTRLKKLGFLTLEPIILKDGEVAKSFDTLNELYTKLLDKKFTRNSLLIALGGGVIGDLVGFVAATYQRGIPFIQVPTTLLAQVDSSVGGKTAVNHPLGKNMIGAFYQPLAVFAELTVLDSLPAREYHAGIAEVIKYGCIYDRSFYQWLEANKTALRNRDKKALAYAVKVSCQIKRDIVQRDEKEISGERALLNFGHTFGHGIEHVLGYGQWLHGEAVSCGMVIAMRLSKQLGYLSQQDEDSLVEFLSYFNLPVVLPENLDQNLLFDAMARDKKNKNNQIRYVILKSIGQAEVSDNLEDDFVKKALI
ncbi:3-dehydroquinate synthase [Thiotrichales bacterium 19S3-7]|nr:3-dehydroquinate synthase [Thiotrichales bacterium 19S3-7]MCF6800781.1 3-dehydroquinate synthase [Thiotrichales bacterium 19S3-11]